MFSSYNSNHIAIIKIQQPMKNIFIEKEKTISLWMKEKNVFPLSFSLDVFLEWYTIVAVIQMWWHLITDHMPISYVYHSTFLVEWSYERLMHVVVHIYSQANYLIKLSKFFDVDIFCINETEKI